MCAVEGVGSCYRLCASCIPRRIRQEAWLGALKGAYLGSSLVSAIALYFFAQGGIELLVRGTGIQPAWLYFPEDCKLEKIRALNFTLCNIPEFAEASTQEAVQFVASMIPGFISLFAFSGFLIGIIIGIAKMILKI